MNRSTDSKKKIVTESLTNSFGAYPIGYALGILILPAFSGWIVEDIFTANLFITLTYATCSFFRIYVVRSLFTRLGYDDNFIKLAVKLYQRGSSAIKSKEWSVHGNVPKTIQY